MTVCVTSRNSGYGCEFYLDGTGCDYRFSLLQSTLDQNSLIVGLSELDLALEEAGCIMLYKDVVDSLILDNSADRDADGL